MLLEYKLTNSLISVKTEEMTRSLDCPILDFYRDSTLLITGGTGFVGKVLIYKLLHCMNVKKIFMLIRVKDNLDAKQRLENYFKESVSM